jgi:hypothetical protein
VLSSYPGNQATNTPKPIDTNLDGHVALTRLLNIECVKKFIFQESGGIGFLNVKQGGEFSNFGHSLIAPF